MPPLAFIPVLGPALAGTGILGADAAIAGGLMTAGVGASEAASLAGMSAMGLGSAASWLSPVMTGVGLVGTGMEMFGQMSSAKTDAEILKANAESARMAGESAVETAKGEQLALSRERRQLIGKQAAAIAGGGVEVSSGSALDVMAATAGNYEQDIATLGQNAQEALKAKTYEASIYDWAAERKKKAGLINAFGTGLTGLSRLGRKYYGLPTTVTISE